MALDANCSGKASALSQALRYERLRVCNMQGHELLHIGFEVYIADGEEETQHLLRGMCKLLCWLSIINLREHAVLDTLDCMYVCRLTYRPYPHGH
jgi:hypothetical protein